MVVLLCNEGHLTILYLTFITEEFIIFFLLFKIIKKDLKSAFHPPYSETNSQQGATLNKQDHVLWFWKQMSWTLLLLFLLLDSQYEVLDIFSRPLQTITNHSNHYNPFILFNSILYISWTFSALSTFSQYIQHFRTFAIQFFLRVRVLSRVNISFFSRLTFSLLFHFILVRKKKTC